MGPSEEFINFARDAVKDASADVSIWTRCFQRADVETLIFAEQALAEHCDRVSSVCWLCLMHVCPRRKVVAEFVNVVIEGGGCFEPSLAELAASHLLRLFPLNQTRFDVARLVGGLAVLKDLCSHSESLQAIQCFAQDVVSLPLESWTPDALDKCLEKSKHELLHLHVGCGYMRGHLDRHLHLHAVHGLGRAVPWSAADWALERALLPGTASAAAEVGVAADFDDALRHLNFLNGRVVGEPLSFADMTMAFCLRPRCLRQCKLGRRLGFNKDACL